MKQGPSPDVRGLFAQAIEHHQAGRLDEAVACYHQVLALKPDLAGAHNNLGNALCEQGKLEEAEASYRRALALQPVRAEAHNNLGTVLYEQERLDEAIPCYRKALALEPDYVEALCNLGAALHRQGNLDEAEANIRRAAALAPDFPRALDNLGAVLQETGRLDEAAIVYRKLLKLTPRDADARSGLAEVLGTQGEPAEALETILQSLQIRETAKARRVFADIVKPLSWTADNRPVRLALTRALTEPWARPGDLARTSASLIKQNPQTGGCIARAAQAWPRALPAPELFGPGGPAALANDRLLLALLGSTQNTDIALERFLTMARRLLLEAAADDGTGDAAEEFYVALVHQCFINEYVFSCRDDEIRRAGDLRDALAAALQAGKPVSSLHLLAVAAYFPLYSVSGAARLLERPWPRPVTTVLVQQLRAPQEEAQLRAAMPSLTPIKSAVSRLVQNQYEENPYPRWVRIPLAERAATITRYLRQKFPHAAIPQKSDGKTVEILCAGCGTGQLALEIAQGIDARISAVDLSLHSLGYAARKARELGLAAIEFAQADLLELGAICRSFDVVECSGVLHHLADPFAGWRVLLSLLRPGGFMMVGLYSQAARRWIMEARQFIARQGYGTSADDIRLCRQDLLDLDKHRDFGVAASDDFYGISSCRDLLFHVQELQTRLPAIADFIRDHGLTFLGFETDNTILQAYRRRFPDDPPATNLGYWQIFEDENPNTFSRMYMFWVQKDGAV